MTKHITTCNYCGTPLVGEEEIVQGICHPCLNRLDENMDGVS